MADPAYQPAGVGTVDEVVACDGHVEEGHAGDGGGEDVKVQLQVQDGPVVEGGAEEVACVRVILAVAARGGNGLTVG